jgi:membrane carboxypeptidase/penicillin-binding protein
VVPVRCLLLVEVVLTGERLADERCQEDRGEEQRESVLSREASHCWVSPTATKKTMPAAISTKYRKNIVRTAGDFVSEQVCPAPG